ncbi:hypothetical protein [Thermococcus sp. JdF3]|uniref:hypothetical protein n=1 Tax=Thermococcus sp. JdF3 TaxID=1638258 RepID=UPI00143CB9A0|nr:hypothetical protein [Thermococcus sp. JdF3]NJE00973.1 hypothetical protein [Thermococcus sp. JdF3]
MRGVALVMAAFLLLQPVLAWETTIDVPGREYQVIEDIEMNYTSSCPQWVFFTFSGPENSETASFFANGSGTLNLRNLSPPVVSSDWKHVRITIEARCPVNITAKPIYSPSVCGEEYYVAHWRYRIVKMPLHRRGDGYFLESPLDVKAIYFSSNRPYVNGSNVLDLPLEVLIKTGDSSTTVSPRPAWDGVWWLPINASGRIEVTLRGEAAPYISEVYALALLPQRESRGFIPAYGDGYHPQSCWPREYLHLSGEAFWGGEDFTLFEYTTPDGKMERIYVKDGYVCARIDGGEACGGRLIPGPSRFEVLFVQGTLYIYQWGREFLSMDVGSRAIFPERFIGLPSKKLYGMEIYGRKPVPWEEKKGVPDVLLGALAIAAGIGIIVVMARRR